MSLKPLPADWRTWERARLESEIQRHNQCYWDQSRAEISDYDYDLLVERLREIDPNASLLDHLGPSLTDALGEPVIHAAPMLSLDKCYHEEGLLKWADKLSGSIMMTPKVDGVACSLRYRADGELFIAATRGDGRQGESITANVIPMESIPKQIPALGVEIEVRGEVYLPLSAFASLTERFSNPRNATAGTLKRKDDPQSAQIGLRFFAYDVFGLSTESASERLDQARSWGFDPVPYELLARDELQRGYERYVAQRSALDYEIDGVVYRVNANDEYDLLGATAHHPRGAIAYKLQGDSATTTLKEIEWGVSRNGVLTPVGIVEPVKLSGAIVSRITLHHWGRVRAKKLSLGAEVVAMRRGGVIPHLEAVVSEGPTPILAPDHCPQCPHLKVPTRVEGDVLFCDHQGTCAPRSAAILSHWVTQTKIEGFGSVWLERLTEAGLLKTPVSLYTLRVEDVIGLEGVGQVRAQRWIESVNQARSLSLSVFLRALGVRDLGRSVSELIAGHFLTLQAVREAKVEELSQLFGLGELTAQHIVSGLSELSLLIDQLLEQVSVLDEVPVTTSSSLEDQSAPLSGQSFVFTGTLASMKRAEAQARVRALGAQTPQSVSAQLSALVIGDQGKAGSKKNKAERLGVKILSEAEFLAILTLHEDQES